MASVPFEPAIVAVDSSVVLAAIFNDEGLREHALTLRADIVAGRLRPVTAAPFRFEIRSALSRGARRRRITWEQVEAEIRALSRLGAVPMATPSDDDLLPLCRDHGLSWADAHWVLAAAQLRIPLVTADRRLATAVPPEVAWVEWLGDRPLDGEAAAD